MEGYLAWLAGRGGELTGLDLTTLAEVGARLAAVASLAGRDAEGPSREAVNAWRRVHHLLTDLDAVSAGSDLSGRTLSRRLIAWADHQLQVERPGTPAPVPSPPVHAAFDRLPELAVAARDCLRTRLDRGELLAPGVEYQASEDPTALPRLSPTMVPADPADVDPVLEALVVAQVASGRLAAPRPPGAQTAAARTGVDHQDELGRTAAGTRPAPLSADPPPPTAADPPGPSRATPGSTTPTPTPAAWKSASTQDSVLSTLVDIAGPGTLETATRDIAWPALIDTLHDAAARGLDVRGLLLQAAASGPLDPDRGEVSSTLLGRVRRALQPTRLAVVRAEQATALTAAGDLDARRARRDTRAVASPATLGRSTDRGGRTRRNSPDRGYDR